MHGGGTQKTREGDAGVGVRRAGGVERNPRAGGKYHSRGGAGTGNADRPFVNCSSCRMRDNPWGIRRLAVSVLNLFFFFFRIRPIATERLRLPKNDFEVPEP